MPAVYEGTIGTAPIVMLIDDTSADRVRGVYFYRSKGLDIAVRGTRSVFEERSIHPEQSPAGDLTATFTGEWTGDSYRGSWDPEDPSKKRAAVRLKRIPFTGTNTSARIRKTTRTATSDLGPATYSLPVITGTSPAWIGIRITADVTAAALLDQTLDDVVAQYKENGGGITGLDVETVHNGDALLDLRIQAETMGAYPDGFEQDRLYDLRTGARLTADDLFTRAGKRSLAALLVTAFKAAVAAQVKARPADAQDIQALVDQAGVRVPDEELASFSISATGPVFHHDFGFPHVAQALEPDGTVGLTWAIVARYVRPDGPLDGLARAR